MIESKFKLILVILVISYYQNSLSATEIVLTVSVVTVSVVTYEQNSKTLANTKAVHAYNHTPFQHKVYPSAGNVFQ